MSSTIALLVAAAVPAALTGCSSKTEPPPVIPPPFEQVGPPVAKAPEPWPRFEATPPPPGRPGPDPCAEPVGATSSTHPAPSASAAAPSPPAPAGSPAAAASASAPSGGTVVNASAVVSQMAAGFRRCYNRGLRDDRYMKGTVRLTAKVGASGEITSVTATEVVGLSQPVVDCLVARVNASRFAEPCGGGATIAIPVSFFPH